MMMGCDRAAAAGNKAEFLTATVGGQLFGLPIGHVHDVFALGRSTRVPRAPVCVAGLMPCRGRIVTLIDLRLRLGLNARDVVGGAMVIGLDVEDDSYGLIVDTMGDVLRLDANQRDAVPANLDLSIASVADRIYRLETGLMVVLDIAKLLDVAPALEAA